MNTKISVEVQGGDTLQNFFLGFWCHFFFAYVWNFAYFFKHVLKHCRDLFLVLTTFCGSGSAFHSLGNARHLHKTNQNVTLQTTDERLKWKPNILNLKQILSPAHKKSKLVIFDLHCELWFHAVIWPLFPLIKLKKRNQDESSPRRKVANNTALGLRLPCLQT